MQGSLLKRCWRANAHDVVIDACLTFVSAALSIAGPYFLKRILEAIQAADVASGGTGRVPKSAYALPLAAFFAAVCKSQSDVQHLFAGRRAGVRVRGELISQIYHKALKTRAMSAGRTEVEASSPVAVDKMSKRDRRKSKGSSNNVPPEQQQPAGKDLGAIVSLMAVDSQKISQLVSGAYFLYSSPVEILVAGIFLYRLLGWSAAVGFSVLLVSTPLQSYLTRRAMHITRELGQARDRRTALIAELYAALRPVRYFAQEEQWTQRVRDAREVELQLLKKRQVLSAGIAVLWAAVPAAITTISFLTYIRTGNRLGIEVAFPAIQTISAMRAALSILPVYITNLLNAGVSMERIETYLATDEVPDVAFAAQRPWLQHATVRENILFGAPFEAERYETVLECCALKPDLVLLPAGDESEVGEGGLVLSGGQRARVALARAMYSRSATVLLDDILSALDAQTSKQVVTTCLNGPLLKGRTCIIVSHHVELVLSIPCALVVKMSHGRIEAQGTPEELREQGHLAAIKAEEAAESIEQDLQAPIAGAQQVEAEGLPAAAPSVPALNGGGSLGNAAALAVEVRSKRERGKLVEKERRAKGAMKVQVYVTYLAAYGSITVALALLALVSRQTFDTGEKFYLSFWGSSYSTKATSAAFAVAAAPQQAISFLFSSVGEGITGLHALTFSAAELHLGQVGASALPPANENVWPYLGGFIAIQVAGSACLCLLILINQSGGRNAARALFIQALETLMRATSRHIDMTPKGRVLNTLSKDVGQVDESVHDTMQAMAGYIIGLVTSLGVITLTLPFMLIPSALLAYANYKVAIGYVRTARSLRRIESTSRSPLISSFSELLSGLDTVRAFCAERRLLGKFLQRLDHTQSAFHYFWMCNRHSLLRLDVLGALGIMGASITALAGGIPAGLAGVALSMASSTTMAIYWLSRYITSLEQDANSLERLQDLITLTPMEASAVIESNRPPASWPSQGAIEVRNLSLQYAPELDPVLHKVTFTVQPGEKIGVVGRTGSGKSTLALALFRHLEYMPGSQILIDGIDVSAIGLRDLRSRLTIIPQDPTLFTGTVRSNLDPFNEHSDEACIEALHRVHLRTTPPVSQPASRMTSRYNTLGRRPSALDGSFASAEDDSGTPGVDEEDEDERSFVTLDSPIADGGTNLSQGQRQLIAMARALLRAGKVIIMDEASSSVDFTTDEAIQSAIQDGFKHSTVLTIAHRLSTVVGYDRILVMDAGRVAEYDTPAALLSKTDGLFKSLCEKSGDYRQLRQVAEEAAEARRSRED
ncbi:Multidrug resistance-associated protein/mitoxantrone resistance protein, ABC superfamily [Ceraceosorus bombacis]|uniref:Multidrug resistance-associated protein/mitoxantrone resistance protein, ABC superfamily n=1 Tax=Ceraceosorus bombacis TaxID=401625 RepID=A0A0N7LAN4_9BASI|nr:Multidrug resistance-associated protein/mitoxantrone resistance protein, ABC superfamily [Ceraceosorus bombacis]